MATCQRRGRLISVWDLKRFVWTLRSRHWVRHYLLAVSPLLVAGALAGVPRASGTTSPVEHVVVILQENHSFDNVLGQLCIQDHRECTAASSGKNEKGETIPLTSARDIVADLPHGQEAS